MMPNERRRQTNKKTKKPKNLPRPVFFEISKLNTGICGVGGIMRLPEALWRDMAVSLTAAL